MNKELLINMFYAAPELWYILGSFITLLIMIILYASIRLLKLKQKNYFVNRDRDRYAETLHASKDGYFSFIYPDDRVNDPIKQTKETCSRRLAVLLELENGISATFDDVLKSFYKDDVKKITKYVNLLREDGISFEDCFVSKNGNRQVNIFGNRINGKDGCIYSDILWFRDITSEKLKINSLIEEKDSSFSRIMQLEDMINNAPFPMWLRDKNLNIIMTNKRYRDLLGKKDDDLSTDFELRDASGDNASRNLALIAITTNKPKSNKINMVIDGQIKILEITESPFYSELNLEKIHSVGAIADISDLEELKRNLRFSQEAQLEILGSIGNTAFALFDNKYKLSFYNKSFKKLWDLEDINLVDNFSYSTFLDIIREKRLLPEVANFINYKEEEIKTFSKIIEPTEDMLHIPNGRTIRRFRAQYPTGGIIFAFEDVSDKLAARRVYNSLISMQKEMVDSITDAILIFDSNGIISVYNQAYLQLWGHALENMSSKASIFDVLETQKGFFSKDDNWNKLKEEVINHLTNSTTKSFILNLRNNTKIETTSKLLSDGSIMVTYKKLSSM